VWQQLAAPRSPVWRGRFLQRCPDYLDATAREAQNGARNAHGPDATRYLTGLRAWAHAALTWNAATGRHRATATASTI
jgi:hypothetical protein